MVARAPHAKMAAMSHAPKKAGNLPRATAAATLSEEGPARSHVAERQEMRRRQILDTAAQLFYTKGYPGMTMNDLCRALGVTKPAVYYYFADKYEIFDILCRESAQTCLPVIRETANPALPVRERLHACLLEMARRCVRCHVAAALSFRDNQYLKADTVDWLNSMAREFYRDLYVLLEEGRAAGVFAFGDARVTAHSMGGVLGFMYTWHEPGRMDPETLANELAHNMMKLVLPPA